MTKGDGLDAYLSLKSQMSTAALKTAVQAMVKPRMEPDDSDFVEVCECIDELYWRHVMQPKLNLTK